MTLHIAGNLHYDPLGRARLKKWFEDLKNKNIQPSYLLLEYNKTDLLAFLNARKEFRNLCEEEYKKYELSDADLDILEKSFGYELDSHLDYFDNIDILYYDKPNFKNSMIKDLIHTNRMYLENYDKNSENFIEILSKELWKYSNKLWESCNKDFGIGRDQYLFEQIKDKTKKIINNNGLLITGCNHARNYPNKLVNLLEKSKIYKNIEITNLECIL